MASSCNRGGLDWIGLSGTGTGCPGKCSKGVWLWLLGMWFKGGACLCWVNGWTQS